MRTYPALTSAWLLEQAEKLRDASHTFEIYSKLWYDYRRAENELRSLAIQQDSSIPKPPEAPREQP